MVHGTSPAPGTAYDIPWDGNCRCFDGVLGPFFTAGVSGYFPKKACFLESERRA